MTGFSPLIYNGQDVWLNDIPFNCVDDFGNKWVISDIDGWWGLPDVEAEEDARPYTQDGSYFTAGRYPSRNITVTGKIVPTYNADAGGYDAAVVARDLLNTRLNMVRSLGLLRVNESPDKIASVQLIGRPLTKFDKLNNVLSFNFQLKAADPRKYSVDPLTVSSSLSEPDSGRTYPKIYRYTYGGLSTGNDFIVDNEGSYDTGGFFKITGPVTNPYIEHVDSGKYIRLNTTLSISDYMLVDLNRRRITLNGQASRKNVLDTRSTWFMIDAGVNTLRYRGSQQIPAAEARPELVNLAVNPAANASGGWSSEQAGGAGDDYVAVRDTTIVRRIGSTSVAVSGNPLSTYYAGSVSPGALRNVGTNGATIPVTVGETYNFSVWVYADAPGINGASIGADFYDSTVTYLSSVMNNVEVTATGGNWIRLSTLLIVPELAVTASLRVSVSSPILPGTQGIVIRFSDSLFTLGDNLYDYFDGTFYGAHWDGAPNQSTSRQDAVIGVPESVVEFTYRSAWIE